MIFPNSGGMLDFFLTVLLTYSFLTAGGEVVSWLPVVRRHKTHTCQGQSRGPPPPEVGRGSGGSRLKTSLWAWAFLPQRPFPHGACLGLLWGSGAQSAQGSLLHSSHSPPLPSSPPPSPSVTLPVSLSPFSECPGSVLRTQNKTHEVLPLSLKGPQSRGVSRTGRRKGRVGTWAWRGLAEYQLG